MKFTWCLVGVAGLFPLGGCREERIAKPVPLPHPVVVEQKADPEKQPEDPQMDDPAKEDESQFNFPRKK